MAADSLRAAPIYQAVNKPVLFAGGERSLVIMLGTMAGMLIWMGASWFNLFLGLFLWFVGIYFLREMAKEDVIMSQVFIKYQRYQHFYVSYTTPFYYMKK